jgi:hypothetical protein
MPKLLPFAAAIPVPLIDVIARIEDEKFCVAKQLKRHARYAAP